MMSSRTPVFRGFPRVGIPPYYGSWEIYSHRVELMMRGGAIPDYTYLWWDVRPHPNLGTVELRVFDQQTRIEHTIGFAALAQSLVHRLAADYDDGVPSVEHPWELIDDNKVRAALVGIEGKLIDFDRGVEVDGEEMAAGVIDDLREHAQELGCEDELVSLTDLIEEGTGARRQLNWFDAHGGDVHGLMREMIAASAP
jgi:carboxylate-amine ligase